MAKRGKARHASSEESRFCPSCGAPLEIEWVRGKCKAATCKKTGGRYESWDAVYFGNQLTAKKLKKTNGLLSPTRDYWCGGCGKKLSSRKSDGLWSIGTNCKCGRCWGGHLLGDITDAMEKEHPQVKETKKSKKPK